ncbi:MAG: shikimate kinase [Robiginitomaculum sp.]|nr:shikimate kinase [Robiginitomaculum sp.]
MKPDITDKANEKQSQLIVLVGLMGVGKSTIGRRLAIALGLNFVDADDEIEKSAGRSISDIFDDFGEKAFRDGEKKVILRLLGGSPLVLATGGGAFLNPDIRAAIAAKGVSVWLRSSLQELVRRTDRRNTRPLLANGDSKEILAELIKQRHPIYAKADLAIDSDQGEHSETVTAIIQALRNYKEQNQ